ncbi:MAG TPA: relaxase/mobilization nuclease domain-containing protein [Candidatus Moranbacteria bacterium]|nr:relaxase/mobilization nuclease domain-containing protein [Candidatus Moranbacteria bacterium]
MATTRLISMHINKGKTIAQCLTDRTDYSKNPDKTNDGEYISAYECDPAIVDAQFLLSKRQYKALTGREQKNDVIAYQIRQSFKPGEITPEEANKIGYELGMCWTKGRHAFIVATHIDKSHIHNHIIYNSTSLDCLRKFRDIRGSGLAVQKISDRLCLEHGLSIVKNPKRKSKHYGKWLGDKKTLSYQDKLRLAIDAALAEKPTDFDAFLRLIQMAGYEVKAGKHLAFHITGQKKNTRLRSLGEGYSEDEIRAVIAGGKNHKPRKKTRSDKQPQRVNLLVDIQAKLQVGKGPGYERWAKVFNLKQMAQTINFLTENNLLEYADLEEKAVAATVRFNELLAQIKAAETRMAEIGNLKTHIINYSKTRDVYTAYRKAGYSKKFYEANASYILLRKAAKAAFDALPGKKIPTIKTLQAEYETLLSEKKKDYSEYAAARKDMRELLTVKMNVDRLCGNAWEETEKNREQDR